MGTVQEVDFRSYVATTMAVEWPEQYPIATLKAGAVATKQFAWYHVIHPRGGTVVLPDGSTACYDVVDSTVDQYYYPEKYGPGLPDGPGPKIGKALDLTWGITVRKYSQRTPEQPVLPDRLPKRHETTTCGADANGFKLFHHSTRACGKDGLTFREILRRYLMPNLEIVTAGRHDVVGSRHGDATAMVLNDQGPPGRARLVAGRPGRHAQLASGRPDRAAELVGFDSDDVSGDGKDDLVWLTRTGTRDAGGSAWRSATAPATAAARPGSTAALVSRSTAPG